MTLYFPQLKYSINVIGSSEPAVQDEVIVEGTIDANGNLATNSSTATLLFGTPKPLTDFTLKVSCDFFRYGGTSYYLPCQIIMSEQMTKADGTAPQYEINFSITNYKLGFYVGIGAYSDGYETNPNLGGNYQYSPLEYTINITLDDYSSSHYSIAQPTGTLHYIEGNHNNSYTSTYSKIGQTDIIPKTALIRGFRLQNFNYERLRTNVNNSYLEINGVKYYAKPTA